MSWRLWWQLPKACGELWLSLSESVSTPLDTAVEKPRRWHVAANWSPLENRLHITPAQTAFTAVTLSDWYLRRGPYLYLSEKKLVLPHISEHTGCVSGCGLQTSRIPSLFCSVPCVGGAGLLEFPRVDASRRLLTGSAPCLHLSCSKHPANTFWVNEWILNTSEFQ